MTITDEQKRQILSLADEIGVTLDGYTAQVYPWSDGRIMIHEMDNFMDDLESNNAPSRHQDMDNKIIVTYSSLEKTLLTKNGKFKSQ